MWLWRGSDRRSGEDRRAGERRALAPFDLERSSPVERVRRALAERISPELREEALRDPVTGALNTRADRAATLRALADRREETHVVRLRADLDNFKALNDVYGHAVGDSALCVVRDALERSTREVDLVSLARPGGDEFALTLRVAIDADPEAIRDRVEQAVNDALAEAGLHRAGGQTIGLSVGAAVVTEPMTLEDLDAAADRAARERKRVRAVSEPRRLRRASTVALDKPRQLRRAG
jgi:diguanylate cyclase (GGDEF)-like protein